jgi:hypothetical protein
MSIALSKLIATFIYPSGIIFILGLLGLYFLWAKRARAAQRFLAAAVLVYMVAASPIVAGWLVNPLE